MAKCFNSNSHTYISLFQNRPVLKNFLLTVILEGLEQKFNMLLSRGMCSDVYV